MRDLDRPILLCFDGSTAAIAAVERAASLFPGARAVVLTTWSQFQALGYAFLVDSDQLADLNLGAESEARSVADRGVQLARTAGLLATAEVLRTHGSTARTIVGRCLVGNCRAVVLGAVGHSVLGEVLLGSVTSAVVHHAPIPVVVVHPGPRRARTSESQREAALALAE